MMKHKIFLLAATVVFGLFITGCTESDELTEITPAASQPQQQEEDEPEAISDELSQQLAAINGISNVVVEDLKDETTGTVRRSYTFFCEQFVDHSDLSKGGFSQRVRIILGEKKDLTAPVVLYSHGYNMPDKAEDAYVPEMSNYLKANTLFVEHRYFGKSLPEPFENLDFTYLNADQAAHDLHLIVSLMKQTVFKQSGKWTSTGISKDGITTGLYAYYSDKYGWDDIDLYMPFCAPYLEGSPASCDDPKMGQYLYNESGKGYPAGSVEETAYQRLRKIPATLLQDQELCEACLRMYNKKDPSNYLQVIKEFGRDEEKATAGIIDTYFNYLFDKFSYVPFKRWASLVPDVDAAIATATTQEEKVYKLYAMARVAEFVFMGSSEVLRALDNSNDYNYYAYNDGDGDGDEPSILKPYIYSNAELLKIREQDPSMPYYVQAVRELGNVRMDLSSLNGLNFPGSNTDFGFLAASVSRQFEASMLYKRYADQWDGGALMKSFRQWVKTQDKYNMIFCYSANDPWTGGAIDPGTNPKVRLSICRDGVHQDEFLNDEFYSEQERQTLLGYVNSFLGQ